MFIRFACLCFSIAVLSACTKPMDTVIPSDISKWEKDLAPAVKKLSEEDQKTLSGYLMRSKLSEAFSPGSGMPFGTTVGTAIQQQKKWAAEQEAKAAEEKALKERLKKEEAAAEAAISDAVAVALISKSQLAKDYEAGHFSARQSFNIGITNKSPKTIAGVSGELEFVDIFDKVVGAVKFSITEDVRPGADAKWSGVRTYNEFIPEHRAVWGLEEGKYTTRFIPTAIVFSDGTKLTAKQ